MIYGGNGIDMIEMWGESISFRLTKLEFSQQNLYYAKIIGKWDSTYKSFHFVLISDNFVSFDGHLPHQPLFD